MTGFTTAYKVSPPSTPPGKMHPPSGSSPTGIPTCADLMRMAGTPNQGTATTLKQAFTDVASVRARLF